MKKTAKLIFSLLLLFLFFDCVQANPIAVKYISEIQFADSSSTFWTIELNNEFGFSGNLDGWYFVSSTDTLFLPLGINPDYDELIVLSADSLQSSFSLNEEGDQLTLYDSSHQWLDEVRFGNIENAVISSPRPGQSICILRDAYYDTYWYIDNTPTIGYPNDLDASDGTVEGHVYNHEGIPQEGVGIVYGFEYSPLGDLLLRECFSDSLGYYHFIALATLRGLNIRHLNFLDQDTTIQVWPDSVLWIDFHLTPVLGINVESKGQIPAKYALKQNFPNPFNSTTTIDFNLPRESQVKVQILRIDGTLLMELLEQQLAAGEYSLSWDAHNVSSGVYFYSIHAGYFHETRKMILLK